MGTSDTLLKDGVHAQHAHGARSCMIYRHKRIRIARLILRIPAYGDVSVWVPLIHG